MIDLEAAREIISKSSLVLSSGERTVLCCALSEIEALRKVAEAAKDVRTTGRYHSSVHDEAMQELDKALSDAGYGGGE